MLQKQLKVNDFVVYPAHGVGKLIARESTEISGYKVDLYVIQFERDRMILRLPVHKAEAAGLRAVSSQDDMKKALEILTTKARVRRTMWSRRAQEYETKINSGNPASIAEVVRELFRFQPDADQSYSERQIYQAAMERLARELAAVEKINETEAVQKMEDILRAA
jgi:CarD family transcriptional regulator